MREFMDGGYRALDALRRSGDIRAIGLGANEWRVCDDALDRGDFDVMLLAGRYTLLEQEPLDRFLPKCAERGVGVVMGGPFNSGILAVGADAASHFDYAPPPPDILDRVRRIEGVCAAFGVALRSAALQFPLAHPATACVLPGLAGAGEVEDAVAGVARPIVPAFWDELKAQGLLRADAPTAMARSRAGDREEVR